MTSSSATSLPPAGTDHHDHRHRHLHHHHHHRHHYHHHDDRPLTLIPRHLSIGGDQADMFPSDVVSLSSSSSGVSLTLTSVSSEVDDDPSCDVAPEPVDGGHGWVGTPAAAGTAAVRSTEEGRIVGRCSQVQGAGRDRGQLTPEAADDRTVPPPPASSRASSDDYQRQTSNKGNIDRPDTEFTTQQRGKEDTRRCGDEYPHQSDKQRVDDEPNKNCQHPRHSTDKERANAKSVPESEPRRFDREKLSSHPHADAGSGLRSHDPQVAGKNPPPNSDKSDRASNHTASERANSNRSSSKTSDSAVWFGEPDGKKTDNDTDAHVPPLNHETRRETTPPTRKPVTVPKGPLALQRLNPENTESVPTVGESSTQGVPTAGESSTEGVPTAGESSVQGVPTAGESSDGTTGLETARPCTAALAAGGGRGDDVTHEADQAVTVTDGESVYHILQRLDQELDAVELSDALDTDVSDEDSLDASWSPDTRRSFKTHPPSSPARGDHEDPVHGNASRRGSSRRNKQPPDLCSLHGGGFCEEHGRYCERGVARESSHDSSPPVHKYSNSSFHRFNSNSLSQRSQNRVEATRDKSPATKTEGSQNVKQFPSWRKPRLFNSQQHWTGYGDNSRPAAPGEGAAMTQCSSTDTDHSSAASDRSSPTVSKLFNAESDGYDVNPFSRGPAATNLYSEDRPSTVGKAYRHPASLRQLFPANTVTEKSLARRPPASLVQLFPADKNTAGKSFVGSRAADVDVSERKVLEELVSTLDSLGPSSYSDAGRRPSAAPQNFFTLQRGPATAGTLWRHGVGMNAVGGQQKFYTLQRGSGDRGKVFGSIRSLDSTGLNGRRRSESSGKGGDLFTGFTHVAPPGDPWSQPKTAWPRHSVSAASGLGTPSRKKGSKRKVLTMPRKGFLDLFRRHSPSPSPSIGSSGHGLHERGELSESGVTPAARGRAAGGGPAVKEDVVFGNNNVGYETADLY